MRELTREEILAMEPGYELDVLVAEKVMEWKVDGSHVNKNGYIAYMADFKASTDIKAAWEVVEKIGSRAEWMLYRLGHTDEDGFLKYDCTFLQVFSGFSPRARGKTAPEAIAKAALLAVLEATP